jgi:phage regulator Rha-like protein
MTMTSRELASVADKRHDNVMRVVESLEEAGLILPQIEEVSNEGPGPRFVRQYRLQKRDSFVVMARLSPEFTARLVDRWQELEGVASKPVELSRMDILRLAMDAEEARIKAESERDEAIRTKALIGSKREATAMATAAKAVREVARLKQELGTNERHATVLAVEKATGKNYSWRPLRQWCADHKVEPATVPDKRYGEVKAWPADAWGECHAVDLHELFSEGKLK